MDQGFGSIKVGRHLTCEVIAPCNAYSVDDSVIEATKKESIVVEVMVKDQNKEFVSMMSFMYPSCKHIHFDEQVVIEWVENAFQPK